MWVGLVQFWGVLKKILLRLSNIVNYYFNEGGFIQIDVPCAEVLASVSRFFLKKRCAPTTTKVVLGLTHRFGLARAQKLD